MSQQTIKRNPWRKRILVSVLILAVAVAGIYWYVATEKFSDTKDRKAAYTVNALDFIREFQQDDSAANMKYREKIITVNGRVSALEAPDTSTVNVKFVDTTTGSYIIFAFQDTHLAEGKSLKTGDTVSIKGSCSGGTYSDILEVTKIDFKRAALNK
ncbi:MAG: hypothetical protein JNK14_04210 [Chitinophagaceae bacterium]|nr:hypothetical protein [Chitinophagaceae bacterium]